MRGGEEVRRGVSPSRPKSVYGVVSEGRPMMVRGVISEGRPMLVRGVVSEGRPMSVVGVVSEWRPITQRAGRRVVRNKGMRNRSVDGVRKGGVDAERGGL